MNPHTADMPTDDLAQEKALNQMLQKQLGDIQSQNSELLSYSKPLTPLTFEWSLKIGVVCDQAQSAAASYWEIPWIRDAWHSSGFSVVAAVVSVK